MEHPPFVAVDVGGTHVRVGLVAEGGASAQAVRILRYRQYACADHSGLADILEAFAAERGEAKPRGGGVSGAVIAAAGHVQADGTLVSANLPWPVSLAALRERLRLSRLELINDFEAVAHAAPYFETMDARPLSGPEAAPAGPVLVVGPGTGLGAALSTSAGGRTVVLPTEAGHAGLAPGTETELALLGELMQRHRHVPAEAVLSGPGLVALYGALCALRGVAALHRTPEAVSAAALAGDDALARECLQTFCAWLGGTVGNLALQTGARRVYLAGGILPRIHGFLAESDFASRFRDKGTMRAALEQVPVRLIEHGQLGVIGAAVRYLEIAQTRQGRRTASTHG